MDTTLIVKMEHTLRELIVANGFKAVYEQLDVLKEEYKKFYELQIAFMNGTVDTCVSSSIFTCENGGALTLHAQAPTPPPTPAMHPMQPQQSDVKQLLIAEGVVERADASGEGKEIVIEQPKKVVPKKMKTIRKGEKVIYIPEKPPALELEPVVEEQVNTFTDASVRRLQAADLVQTLASAEQQPKRSSAEMKKWQREQEAARRVYMKTNKISRSLLMTEENVRKWIEEEGNSYAWVAREQLGCKEEDVSRFAKEHKIVRKR